MRIPGLCLSALLILASGVHAASITFNNVRVAAATDVFSGPGFILTDDLLPTDTFSLVAYGEVFLQSGKYGTNAAGVVTTAGSEPVGNTLMNGSTNFGALLFGNDLLGFHQLFLPNVSGGIGTVEPPYELSLAGQTLSSVGFTGMIQAGTELQFRISDTNTFDNSGMFHVTGSFNSSEIPEPATVTLMGAGILALGLIRRRME